MITFILTYLLISNALTLRKDKSILFSRVTVISLVLNTILTFNNTFLTILGKGIGLYGGLFHVTPFTNAFNIFICITSSMILTITSFYPRKLCNENDKPEIRNVKDNKKETSNDVIADNIIGNVVDDKFSYNYANIANKMGEQFRILEYPLIAVFVLTGAVFLMSASDLISIFLSIELQSYGLYIISTLYRDSEQATSGALTYFLLGGLSSCFILLGSALLYVNSGTTNLDGIYLISSISEISTGLVSGENLVLSWYKSYYIHLSLIILLVGFLFKISAAPFHFWSPDVYDAIPTVVTTFVAIIAKLSIFIFFLELVFYIEKSVFTFSWTNCILISSMFSLIIGSVLGLTQFRIKRLFAYSTISHVGFILLALSINSIESIQAYIFYIITYTLSNLNGFVILIAIGYSLYTYVYKDENYKDNLTDKNNSPIQLIDQIKGYFYVNPYLALSLAITLFSFVGVPPLIGFFAKQMVLSAALDNGYVFMSIVAILTSVVGAVYYLNLVNIMFFSKSEYIINPALAPENMTNTKLSFNVNNIVLASSLSAIISVLTLFLLMFIYIPNELFSIVNILVLLLFKS